MGTIQYLPLCFVLKFWVSILYLRNHHLTKRPRLPTALMMLQDLLYHNEYIKFMLMYFFSELLRFLGIRYPINIYIVNVIVRLKKKLTKKFTFTFVYGFLPCNTTCLKIFLFQVRCFWVFSSYGANNGIIV